MRESGQPALDNELRLERLGVEDVTPRGFRRAQVRPGLRWHDLRHHAATTWLDIGVPAHDVREFMGFSSLAVTSFYTMAGKQAARRTVEPFYLAESPQVEGGQQ